MENINFYDGESINNKYVLLSNQNKHILNLSGLSALDCINFLYDTSGVYSYFFGINYDINKIFENIDSELRKKLFENKLIKFENFHIQYFEGKFLTLTKFNKKKSLGKKYFFDIINFFNTSFIKTLDILEIDYKIYKKELISGKLERKNFTENDISKIIKYNEIECILGIEIVNKIYELLPNNLKTYKLYGSSSLAKIFLTECNIPKSDSVFCNNEFQSAYFGGRIEAIKIGKIKDCYYYDINSAYPSVIKDLREILFFEKRKFLPKEKIINENLYRIEFENKDIKNIGNFPIRLKSGYLVFPKKGSGWYYGIELKEALEFNYIKIFEVIDITLGSKIFKKNEIEKMYFYRLKLKKENNKRQLIYKILLNSLYGKFAQKNGFKEFTNLYYAGYITASIRAKLFNSVKKYQNKVIYFATDGIMIEQKLNLKINDEIGNFSETKVKKGFVGLAGVYYYYTDKNDFECGLRGVKKENYKQIFEDLERVGKSKIESINFITNKLADKNHVVYKDFRCKFITESKELNVYNQIKRKFVDIDLQNLNESYLIDIFETNQLNLNL